MELFGPAKRRPAAANENGERLTSRFAVPRPIGEISRAVVDHAQRLARPRHVGLTLDDLAARTGPPPESEADYAGGEWG